MARTRQNLRKRAQWFEDLAVVTDDPERAAEYARQATYLDRRRADEDPDPCPLCGLTREHTHAFE